MDKMSQDDTDYCKYLVNGRVCEVDWSLRFEIQIKVQSDDLTMIIDRGIPQKEGIVLHANATASDLWFSVT